MMPSISSDRQVSSVNKMSEYTRRRMLQYLHRTRNLSILPYSPLDNRHLCDYNDSHDLCNDRCIYQNNQAHSCQLDMLELPKDLT